MDIWLSTLGPRRVFWWRSPAIVPLEVFELCETFNSSAQRMMLGSGKIVEEGLMVNSNPSIQL